MSHRAIFSDVHITALKPPFPTIPSESAAIVPMDIFLDGNIFAKIDGF